MSYNYCFKKITLMSDISTLFDTRNNKSLLPFRQNRFQVQILVEVIFFAKKFFAVFKMFINIISINLTINFICNFNFNLVLELL